MGVNTILYAFQGLKFSMCTGYFSNITYTKDNEFSQKYQEFVKKIPHYNGIDKVFATGFTHQGFRFY